MENFSASDKELLQQLASGNMPTVMQSIDKIRESGKTSFVPPILQIYRHNTNPEIGKRIELLLTELKLQPAVPFIMSSLHQPEFQANKRFLISLAWLTSLDFSDYADDFVKLLIHETDFMIAFEAFTVLENMDASYPKLPLTTYIQQLKHASLTDKSEKQSLYMDLIHAFEQAQANLAE